MADLRPIGSEKLEGSDKLKRIMEIANYGKTTSNINESSSTSTEYSIQLADGNYYGIVKEKSGYIVKKGINESEFDYIEPMKNRKYYNSYSQAMKKINLMAGELNRLHENEEGVNLIGEQKKFVLKTPKPAEPEVDMDAPKGEDDEEVSFKVIQKLTGKLGQKLRTLESSQGITSENIKYVLNSVLSALDLSKLTEEDYDDVMANFEEDEDAIDYGVEDDTEIDVEAGDELDFGGDMESDAEMGEMKEYFYDDMDLGDGEKSHFERGSYDKEDHKLRDRFKNRLSRVLGVDSNNSDEDGLDKDEFRTPGGFKYGEIVSGEKSEGKGYEKTMDEIFSESKIEKVLSKYFVVSEGEKKLNKDKQVKKYITERVKNSLVRKEIRNLSETVEQELTADFIIKEHDNVKFIGKTNKGNLVFEADGKSIKVSIKGEIL